MAIEFTCQSCSATLRAKESFAGRKSRCPHCGEPMRVPEPAAAEDVLEGADVFEEEDETFAPPLPSVSRTGQPRGNAMDDFLEGRPVSSPTRPKPSRQRAPRASDSEEVTCAVCGTRNDPDEEACRGCGEPMSRRLAPGGYEDGEIEPTIVGFQEIFQAGWDVFVARIGHCIGGYVITSILMAIGFVVAFVVVFGAFAVADVKGDPNLLVLTLLGLVGLMLLLVVSFLYAGQMLFFAGIARGDEPDFGLLFRGWPLTGRVMMLSLLLSLFIGVGLVLLIVPGIIVMLIYFPAVNVLVDRDCSVGEAMSTASEITKGNRGTLFLILLAAMAMGAAASALQGLGHIFLTPFLTVLYFVAYRMMAGLPVPESD